MTYNERINLIHLVKSYGSPPFDSDDIYYYRVPWCKFGGISSGIYEGWNYFTDDIVEACISDEELLQAVTEIEVKEKER